jgi:cytochrome c-type biogenesis protein CcmH/NrfG
MFRARCLVLASVLLSAAWSWGAESSPSSGKFAAAAIKHYSDRCRAYRDLDSCSDAVRWSPGDPALLVLLGDALVRAKRPADAIKVYRSAAALAPDMHGIAEKISVTEAKLSSKRTRGNLPVDHASDSKRYSNAAPEAQSH